MRRLSGTRGIFGLLVAGWILSSCAVFEDGDCDGVACGAAAPPLEIVVLGVPDATVTVARQDGAAVETACDSVDSDTLCTSNTAPPATQAGLYLVHVEAPGRVAADLEVVVAATPPGGCCNPGYVAESVTIELDPA